MPRSRTSYASSENEAEDNRLIFVTKNSLDEAVALVFEEESEDKGKKFGGTKALRECRSSSFKALGLQAAAENYTPESATMELLKQLRASLLENNTSGAAQLLEILLQSSNLMLPIIWKTAVVLFLDYKNSSEEGCLQQFLEMCANKRLPEDKRHLIETLLTLPESLELRNKDNLKAKPKLDNMVPLSDEEDEDDPFKVID